MVTIWTAVLRPFAWVFVLVWREIFFAAFGVGLSSFSSSSSSSSSSSCFFFLALQSWGPARVSFLSCSLLACRTSLLDAAGRSAAISSSSARSLFSLSLCPGRLSARVGSLSLSLSLSLACVASDLVTSMFESGGFDLGQVHEFPRNS